MVGGRITITRISEEEVKRIEKQGMQLYIASAIGAVSSIIPYAMGGFIHYFSGQEYIESANTFMGIGHGILGASAAILLGNAMSDMTSGGIIRSKLSKNSLETKTSQESSPSS